VITFAAAMMGTSQVYIEKRSATFSVIPAAQTKSDTVGPKPFATAALRKPAGARGTLLTI
jgi:hypothetical protein